MPEALKQKDLTLLWSMDSVHHIFPVKNNLHSKCNSWTELWETNECIAACSEFQSPKWPSESQNSEMFWHIQRGRRQRVSAWTASIYGNCWAFPAISTARPLRARSQLTGQKHAHPLLRKPCHDLHHPNYQSKFNQQVHHIQFKFRCPSRTLPSLSFGTSNAAGLE